MNNCKKLLIASGVDEKFVDEIIKICNVSGISIYSFIKALSPPIELDEFKKFIATEKEKQHPIKMAKKRLNNYRKIKCQ